MAESAAPWSCRIADAKGETETTWFAVFEFDDGGYVKDDEKESLDADAIMASLKEGNEHGNRERRERGWEAIYLDGWQRAPYFDDQTKNLTWATQLHSEDSSQVLNHSVRLLGRGGVMSVDLVVSPEYYEQALPVFNAVIGDFKYKTGHTYAEWRDGDKIAAYGLTAAGRRRRRRHAGQDGAAPEVREGDPAGAGRRRRRHPEVLLRQAQGLDGQGVTVSLLDGVDWQIVGVFFGARPSGRGSGGLPEPSSFAPSDGAAGNRPARRRRAIGGGWFPGGHRSLRAWCWRASTAPSPVRTTSSRHASAWRIAPRPGSPARRRSRWRR